MWGKNDIVGVLMLAAFVVVATIVFAHFPAARHP